MTPNGHANGSTRPRIADRRLEAGVRGRIVIMNPMRIAEWSDLADRTPTGALIGNTDLVIVRFDDQVSVLYGRCLHRGALLADGAIDGDLPYQCKADTECAKTGGNADPGAAAGPGQGEHGRRQGQEPAGVTP